MITRRSFLYSSSSLLTLSAVGAWSTERADAGVFHHRPHGKRPVPPFDAASTSKFVTPLINPLNPTFPGVRRPPSDTAATVTIKESTLSLGLNRPNGAPLVTRVWGYGLGQATTVTVPGFEYVDRVLSRADREAIVKGYAGKAGFALSQVNRA